MRRNPTTWTLWMYILPVLVGTTAVVHDLWSCTPFLLLVDSAFLVRRLSTSTLSRSKNWGIRRRVVVADDENDESYPPPHHHHHSPNHHHHLGEDRRVEITQRQQRQSTRRSRNYLYDDGVVSTIIRSTAIIHKKNENPSIQIMMKGSLTTTWHDGHYSNRHNHDDGQNGSSNSNNHGGAGHGCHHKILVEKEATTSSTRTRTIRSSSSSSSSNVRRRLVLTALTGAATNYYTTTTSSRVSWALTPEQAAREYDRYAPTYDWLDGGGGRPTRTTTTPSLASSSSGTTTTTTEIIDALGIPQARANLIGQARGHVLEIGAGTGLNLPYYNVSQIESLTLLDISSGMLQQAQQRVHEWQQQQQLDPRDLPPIQFIQADATSQLVDLFGGSNNNNNNNNNNNRTTTSPPFYFDTVVDTFSFCVMGLDGARNCLQQMSRVVKPNQGRILLLENTRSNDNAWLAWYQDVTADAAAVLGGKGCVYNQNVRQLLLQQNSPPLQIESEQSYAAGVIQAFVVSVVGGQ